MTEKTYPEWVQTESEQQIHDDFRVFLFLIWKHLKLPSPTPLQYAIALYLARGAALGGNPRRMIQAFRGCGKSWITCAYALWRLYRNPNERIKIVSANEDKALENATFIKRLIEEVEQLRFLRPKNGQRDATCAFDVGPAQANPAPSVSCLGIKGQLTGGRATILISDDVEVPKNSFTEAMREQLADLVKEYDALVVPEGFDIIYLGTPQTEQSIYNLVRQRGYDCRVWPARYPKASSSRYGDSLAPEIRAAVQAKPELAGTSTEPRRFTDLDLAARELSYGRSGFALQFMLDTTLSDAERYPLKTADLVCMDIDAGTAPVRLAWSSDPRMAVTDIDNVGFAGDRLYRPMNFSDAADAFQGRLMIVDPSGRGKDETSYVVLFQLNGFLFLKACGGFTGGYEEPTLQGLANMAKKHQVGTILIESNFGDGMFAQLLKPYLTKRDENGAAFHPCTLEEIRAQGQKELRIIADLEPVLNQHRLVIDAGCAREDVKSGAFSLLYQLTHITKDRNALKHDDRLDALAHGVRYFHSRLARDASQAEEAHLAKLREAEHRKFMSHANKRQPHKPSFQQNNRASRGRR